LFEANIQSVGIVGTEAAADIIHQLMILASTAAIDYVSGELHFAIIGRCGVVA